VRTGLSFPLFDVERGGYHFFLKDVPEDGW
jgi:hypothetical protein